MLLELAISNFALIDDLRLEFEQGFSVLTGETGAGKSIIIDAIGMLLGSRASTDFIRTGSETAYIEGCFEIPEGIENLLEQWGIEGENTLIVSRQIQRNGRNKCRLNGKMVTLNQLQELAPFLVDIVGQHDQQSLLQVEKHIDILDGLGDREHLNLVQKVSEVYQRLHNVRSKLNELEQNERERVRRIEFLEYQTKEIEEANLSDVKEEETLLQERKRLSSIEKLSMGCQSIYAALQLGNQQERSIIDGLSSIASEITELANLDPNLSSINDTISQALIQLQDCARELRILSESYQADPYRLQIVQERLQQLNDLKRKYGSSIYEILEFAKDCYKELEELTNSEQVFEELVLEKQKLALEWDKLADQLTVKRKELAKRFEKQIEEELAQLKMEKTSFQVEITPLPQSSAKGKDDIEFLISPNVGEELKPLARISSGGELSRILLALKSITAASERIPTLILDEIDAGIGGRTAQSIAYKIRNLSKVSQVFCITHLPVIAGFATNHYLVEKFEHHQRTKVEVKRLSYSERIAEISRMLGSDQSEEITVEHAKELLRRGNAS